MKIDNLYFVGKMFKNVSPDSVRSGRTCPANLGVRFCPDRKLICPVWSSPNLEQKCLFMCFNAHRTHIGGGFCPNVEKSLNNPARLVVNKWRTFAASRLSPYFYLVPESFSRPNNFHYTKVISQ